MISCVLRSIFQRFHVVTYKQAVDTWDEVDATLVKWRKEANSEKDLTECVIFITLCYIMIPNFL